MIRGYVGGSQRPFRPYVVAKVAIPGLDVERHVHFLIDTGADSTVLSPRDATALNIDLSRLPAGAPSTLRFIPSLLGRDILSRFALFYEERRSVVLLLEPDEADAINLP